MAFKVLVVEDFDPLRTLIAEVIQHAGWTVVEAANGNAARQRLEEGPFDLILTDLVLPDMNGTDLLQEIRSRLGEQVPICVVSGRNPIEVRQECEPFQVFAFLLKPFPVPELLKLLDQVAEMRPADEGGK